MRYYWLLKILSYLPLLNVSDDGEFGDITPDSSNLRYSLITVRFGEYILHLFSIKQGRFEFIKLINLKELVCSKYEANVSSISKYSNFVAEREDDEEVRVNIETLKLKISEQSERKNVTLTKAWIYNAVLLMLVSLGLPYAIKLWKVEPLLLALFCIWVGLRFTSALVLSLAIVKVGGFETFNFTEIAKCSLEEPPQNPLRVFASKLYDLYLNSKAEGDRVVSYNTNLQRDIKYLLVLIFLLVVYLNIAGILKTVPSIIQPSEPENSVYKINLDEDEKRSLISLVDIEKTLLNEKVSKVVILGGTKSSVEDLEKILQTFNVSSAPIYKLFDNKNDDCINIFIIKE